MSTGPLSTWHPEPTGDSTASIVHGGAVMTFNQFSGHFLTREEVAELLDCSVSAVARHDDLVQVSGLHPGEEIYPALQFDPSGSPTPNMGELVRLLGPHLDEREIASFCTYSMRSLGGRSPIEWLRHGGAVESAVQAAFAA